MIPLLIDYGLFLLKVLTIVAAIAAVVILVAGIGARQRKGGSGGKLVITRLDDQLEEMKRAVSTALLDAPGRKLARKARKAQLKRERKEAKAAARRASAIRGDGETVVDEHDGKRVFVLDFDGDIRASAVERLRREISAILTSARADDEVVVRLESGGGLVSSYGLAASQLDRLREHRVPLTVCVDRVAASGGYMMACVANRLVAAPFAVVGSIGVVAQIPNFHRLLKHYNIDFELLTAGKFKRTLTLFGENTDEARDKFLQDIERIHDQFKQYVDERRPSLDIEAVSTGEIWSGQDALDRSLVDQLSTSDEYLVSACADAAVLHVRYREKRGLAKRFGKQAETSIDNLLMRWYERLQRNRITP